MECSARVVVASVVAGCVLAIPGLTWACGAIAAKTVAYESPQEAELVHEAETMFYVDRGDGRWTVYQGRSIEAGDAVEEFAWLLPVPGVPDVELAPGSVFARLAGATAPVFELKDESTGDCPAEATTILRTFAEGAGAGGDGASAVDVEFTAPVRAVGAGSVGPYEHVTIETEEGIDDPGEKAARWLEEHGYRVKSVDVDLLGEYLDDGLNLLAMRLNADAGASDVQPVAITVELEGPVSPMRLAQAGAAEETDILVWVAGQGRALSHGWPRVEIDEGLVNWREGGENYPEVVAAAVEEAGGRGFATDYAMATEESKGVLWSEEESSRWEELRAKSDFSGVEAVTFETIVELVGGEELLTPILREKMPLPGSRELRKVIELGEFSARYRPGEGPGSAWRSPVHEKFKEVDGEWQAREEPRVVPWREDGPGPEELLEAIKDGGLVASCFAAELQEDPSLHGEWSGRIHPVTYDDLVGTVESTLNPSFDECIVLTMRDHLEEAKYASKTFPVSLSFRFSSPYECHADEEGCPALQSSTYRGVEEVDWAAVVTRVDEAIVVPLQSAQERLDATGTLTRLSTSVAAQNLTRDVIFPVVSGYGEVPAVRRATRLIDCDSEEVRHTSEGSSEVRDWSLELERGQKVEGRGDEWPVSVGDREAARLVVEYDRWGQVVDERGDAVDGEINYIEVDVDEEGNDGEPEEFEESEREVDDGAAPNEAGADEASEDEGDANTRWQWLLGALAAFSLVSLVLWALRRTDK